jgi:hypothetical protein
MYGMRQFYEREARKGKIDIYKTRAMCIAAKYVCSLYIVSILQSNHSIPSTHNHNTISITMNH